MGHGSTCEHDRQAGDDSALDAAHRLSAYQFGVVMATSCADPDSLDAMMRAVARGIADASAGVHPVTLGRDPQRPRTGFQLAALTAMTDSASRARDALAAAAWASRTLSAADIGRACGMSRESVHRRFRR